MEWMTGRKWIGIVVCGQHPGGDRIIEQRRIDGVLAVDRCPPER